jgi:lipopolysaccharide biosynthesis protein
MCNLSMKILSTVHVFYPEFWPELGRCLRNVCAPCDVVATVPEGAAFADDIRRDFPDARILFCENRGFDVWPFLKSIDEVGLDGYTHILKLHTKRDVLTDPPTTFNDFNYGGPRWRRALLSFLADKSAFEKCRALFERDRSVSMIAGRDVIVRRRDVGHPDVQKTFDEAISYAAEKFGLRPTKPEFVAGTMFLAKAEVFRPFVGRFSASDFVQSVKDDRVVTLAHLLERAFGFSACAAGRIADPDDSMRWRHMRSDLSYAMKATARFLYQSKTTRSGARMTKICRVPVWHSAPKQ